jgi:hypothetical protein
MSGHSDRDGVQTGRHLVRYDRRLPQHECERTGPEAGGERVCLGRDVYSKLRERGHTVHVDYQWIGRRTTLRVEDPTHGISIERVCTQPVDGFGGEGNKAAVTQDRGCVRDGDAVGMVGVNDENFGHELSASYLTRAVS